MPNKESGVMTGRDTRGGPHAPFLDAYWVNEAVTTRQIVGARKSILLR